MNTSFAAIADVRRIDILDALRGGGRSVGEIGAVVGLDRSTVSKNLMALRHAGLVIARKDGRRRIYQLHNEKFARLAERLAGYAEPPAALSAPGGVERFPMLRLLLNARLMRFFYLIRSMGWGQVDEAHGFSLLCKNILSLIGSYGGMAGTELVAFSGEEKGQVSRAVKILTEMDLISRENLRAKIILSARGEELFRRFMALTTESDARIRDGLDGHQLQRLRQMTQTLTERALLLLAEEQGLSGADEGVSSSTPLAAAVPDFDGMLGELVTPALLRLTAYLRRSATIAYRREAGLSNLAWLTITQIGEHEQLNLTDLARLIDRDKAQISRIVRDHKAAGLLKRQRCSRDGRTCLVLTSVGNDIYNRMCDRAIKRDEFMFRDISPEERLAYLSNLDVLINNAGLATPPARVASMN